jgi:predicted ATPase
MLIRYVHLTNLLSFGPTAERVELRALNVLIGPNGSGKSNFLEALSLFQAAPSKLTSPVRDGGGVGDWLWKPPSGEKGGAVAHVEAVFEYRHGQPLRHVIEFSESGGRFYLEDERIENEDPLQGQSKVFFYYHFNGGRPMLSVQQPKILQLLQGEIPSNRQNRQLKREDVDPELSILAQRRDPDSYPEITYLATELTRVRFYREWSFGRYSAPRMRQRTDAPADFVEADCSNLGLVLNTFEPPAKKRLIKALRALYEGIEDFHVRIVGGDAQVFLQEQDRLIPATR